MNIPQIQINQTFGQLSMQRIPGKMEIEQPHAKVEMDTDHSFLHIETINGHLEIDQSRAWAAYGMMNSLELTKHISSQIPSIVNEAIANISQKGKRLANIHKKTNAIADLAFESMFRSNPINYVGPASSNNVDIHYSPGSIRFNPTEAKVHMQVETFKPIINYQKGHLEIGMLQYPSIEIEWKGNHIDESL